MNKDLLELYSDYLPSSFGRVTATGLSAMTGGDAGHDGITRFPASERDGSSGAVASGQAVGASSRERRDGGVLVIDDTIEEKPHADESELVCWHYDHSEGRPVEGLDLVGALYRAGDVSVPVAFGLVKESGWVFDGKKGKRRRKSLETENEPHRGMLRACRSDQIRFRYVLSDVRYSASENMGHTKRELEKEFTMPLESNRKVALSPEDKRGGASTSESRSLNRSRTPRGKSTWSRSGSPCFWRSGSSRTRTARKEVFRIR